MKLPVVGLWLVHGLLRPVPSPIEEDLSAIGLRWNATDKLQSKVPYILSVGKVGADLRGKRPHAVLDADRQVCQSTTSRSPVVDVEIPAGLAVNKRCPQAPRSESLICTALLRYCAIALWRCGARKTVDSHLQAMP